MDHHAFRDLSYDEMIDALRSAEVISVFFPSAMQALILDMRRTLHSGPKVMLDGIVESGQARLRSFRRLRPDLPLPSQLTLMPWTGYVRQFEAAGLLEVVRDRCRWEGDEPLAEEADRCFRQLVKAERAIRREIVFGAGMQTLWQRRGEPRG